MNCRSADQAIMLTKAALMGDELSFATIAGTEDPGGCVALGRAVQGFQPHIWEYHLADIIHHALKAKFESCESCRMALEATGQALLAVESPGDMIWGVGVTRRDSGQVDRDHWGCQSLT